MNGQNDLWNRIWEGLEELKDRHGEEMVLIGGIACWLHAHKKISESYIDLSHDGGFYISLGHMVEIREDYGVTQNKRLGKSEIKIKDVAFDIYVEGESNLCVPYADIISKSIEINGFKCASLPHLLSLKMDAYIDRKNSAKGEKDRRDIARILIICGMEKGHPGVADVKYLSDDSVDEIGKIVKSNSVFLEITKNNNHEAKKLKKDAMLGYEKIKNAYSLDNEIGR